MTAVGVAAVETFKCGHCGATMGIAGALATEDDYAAQEHFDSEVAWHESGDCTPKPTTVPRTMAAVSASLDAVALRVDEAGVPLAEVMQIAVRPRANLLLPVEVSVLLTSEQAFTALLLLLPGHTDPEAYVNGGWIWLRAAASLRDGTEVRVVAEVGPVAS